MDKGRDGARGTGHWGQGRTGSEWSEGTGERGAEVGGAGFGAGGGRTRDTGEVDG